MRTTFALIGILLLATSANAASPIQTAGPEVWNGKVQAGFNPIGFQAGFQNTSVSGYKISGDVAGLVGSTKALSIWLGGAFNPTIGTFGCHDYINSKKFLVSNNCGNDLQFSAFVMLTLEKLLQIPLVPFVRGGLTGDALLFDKTGGAVGVRVGGGVHYYIIRTVGLGIETNFTFGPGFLYGGTFFYGSWDFAFGARFSF